MAHRGIFAELQRQAKIAARERERQTRTTPVHAAVRQAKKTRKAEERAQAQLARATEAERKALAKQSRDAHIAAMEAEVEKRNRCGFAATIIEVRRQYGLTIDQREADAIDQVLASCTSTDLERTTCDLPSQSAVWVSYPRIVPVVR